MFWTYIESLDSFLESQTTSLEDLFSFSLQKANDLLDENELSLLEYALNLRYFSPLVQKYREFIAQQKQQLSSSTEHSKCPFTWASFRGQIYCDASTLIPALR